MEEFSSIFWKKLKNRVQLAFNPFLQLISDTPKPDFQVSDAIYYVLLADTEACALSKTIFIIRKFAKITKLDFVALNKHNHNGLNGPHGENVQCHVVEVIDYSICKNNFS